MTPPHSVSTVVGICVVGRENWHFYRSLVDSSVLTTRPHGDERSPLIQNHQNLSNLCGWITHGRLGPWPSSGYSNDNWNFHLVLICVTFFHTTQTIINLPSYTNTGKAGGFSTEDNLLLTKTVYFWLRVISSATLWHAAERFLSRLAIVVYQIPTRIITSYMFRLLNEIL